MKMKREKRVIFFEFNIILNNLDFNKILILILEKDSKIFPLIKIKLTNITFINYFLNIYTVILLI